MTMTGSQTPTRTNKDSLTFSDVKNGAAIAVTMVWVLALLSFAASLLAYWITGSPYGRQFATLIAVLVLFVTTPLLLFFALPTLIKNYMRRRALLTASQNGDRNP
jgi:uncharacterized membrane protein